MIELGYKSLLIVKNKKINYLFLEYVILNANKIYLNRNLIKFIINYLILNRRNKLKINKLKDHKIGEIKFIGTLIGLIVTFMILV